MEASLAIYDALVKINVPHAEAREVVNALERDMTNTLATKADIAALAVATKADIAALAVATKADMATLRAEFVGRYELIESRMSLMESRITIRLGGLLAAGIGLIATLLTVYRT